MPDQQYTFIHPTDHHPYHTDRRTAEFLLDAKRRDMIAYEAAFAHGRDAGRIVDGVAPRLDAEPVVEVNGTSYAVPHYVAERLDRDHHALQQADADPSAHPDAVGWASSNYDGAVKAVEETGRLVTFAQGQTVQRISMSVDHEPRRGAYVPINRAEPSVGD